MLIVYSYKCRNCNADYSVEFEEDYETRGSLVKVPRVFPVARELIAYHNCNPDNLVVGIADLVSVIASEDVGWYAGKPEFNEDGWTNSNSDLYKR